MLPKTYSRKEIGIIYPAPPPPPFKKKYSLRFKRGGKLDKKGKTGENEQKY